MSDTPLNPGQRKGPGRPAGSRSGEAREALLVAARELMAEKGLPRVTLREVGLRAGVQPALVNYYFGGKEGLLRAVVAGIAGGMVERIQQALTREGPVEDRLRGLVEAITSAVSADPYAPRLIVEQVLFAEDEVIDAFVEQYARPNLSRIRALLEEGRESGTIRAVNPMFLVPSLLGVAIFFFLAAPVVQRLFDVDEITPALAAEFSDQAAALILHGVLTPAASSPENPTRASGRGSNSWT